MRRLVVEHFALALRPWLLFLVLSGASLWVEAETRISEVEPVERFELKGVVYSLSCFNHSLKYVNTSYTWKGEGPAAYPSL